MTSGKGRRPSSYQTSKDMNNVHLLDENAVSGSSHEDVNFMYLAPWSLPLLTELRCVLGLPQQGCF